MKRLQHLLPALVLALATGCAFVPLTPDGETVRVARPDAIGDCEHLGSTTATQAERIGPFKRPPESIEEELEHAARNAAAEMGGDTITPRGPVRDGQRTFDVHRCRP
ncbi:MAG: DUF4156 domain-containing protein [Ectothiorhodospira sp.]